MISNVQIKQSGSLILSSNILVMSPFKNNCFSEFQKLVTWKSSKSMIENQIVCKSLIHITINEPGCHFFTLQLQQCTHSYYTFICSEFSILSNMSVVSKNMKHL